MFITVYDAAISYYNGPWTTVKITSKHE